MFTGGIGIRGPKGRGECKPALNVGQGGGTTHLVRQLGRIDWRITIGYTEYSIPTGVISSVRDLIQNQGPCVEVSTK